MKTHAKARFQLVPRESVRDGILRITRSLAQEQALPNSQPRTELPKIVHETRLAIKRTRAIVRLLRPTLEPRLQRGLDRALRTGARSLAAVRDANVGLDLLDRLARQRPSATTSAVAEVRAGYAKTVHAPAQSTPRTLRALAQARTTLRKVALALEKAPWKQRGWGVLSSGLEAGYRRARKRFRDARKDPTPDTLHAWRTACKALLYQLDLVRPMASRSLERSLQGLDELQNSLGQASDVANLSGRLTQKPRQFGAPTALQRTRGLLESQLRTIQKRALKQGRKVLSDRTPEFLDRLAREWKAWRRVKK